MSQSSSDQEGFHNPARDADAGAAFQHGVPQGMAQPSFESQPPPLATPNPLGGTPASDWVRDGAALVILVTALVAPWATVDGGGVILNGASHVWVLLSIILSILSLSLAYLARFGVLGASTSVNGVLAVRALMNAPLVIATLVYMIIDMVGASYEDVVSYGLAGLGVGGALALAGATLAAQPREFEVQSEGVGGPVARTWRWVVLAFGAIAVVSIIVTIVKGIVLVNMLAAVGYPAVGIVPMVISLMYGAVVLCAFWALQSGGQAARIVVLAGAAALVFAAFVFSDSLIVIRAESTILLGFPTVWLGLAAGIAASPGIRLLTPVDEPFKKWRSVISAGLLITLIGCSVLAASVIVTLFFAPEDTGFSVGVLLCLIVSIVGLLIARVQFNERGIATRNVVLAVLGGVLVLGIVAMVLKNSAYGVNWQLGVVNETISNVVADPSRMLAVQIFFPVLLAGALLLPTSMRMQIPAGVRSGTGVGVARATTSYPRFASPAPGSEQQTPAQYQQQVWQQPAQQAQTQERPTPPPVPPTHNG